MTGDREAPDVPTPDPDPPPTSDYPRPERAGTDDQAPPDLEPGDV